MLSRRSLVGRIATGVAGAAVVLKGRRSFATVATPEIGGEASNLHFQPEKVDVVASTEPQLPTLAAPWSLLVPLVAGDSLAGEWTLSSVSEIIDGSAVIALRNAAGRERRVHLCRRAGAAAGVAHSAEFDLVLMNGGSGDLPTDENLARAIAKLAAVLGANERRPAASPVLAALLPQAERERLFADSVHARLR